MANQQHHAQLFEHISKTRFLAIDIHKFHRILTGVIVSTDTTAHHRVRQNCTALHISCSFCPVGSIVCTELHRLGQLRQIPVNYNHVAWYFAKSPCSCPKLYTLCNIFASGVNARQFPRSYCILCVSILPAHHSFLCNHRNLDVPLTRSQQQWPCKTFLLFQCYANNIFSKSGKPLHLSYTLTQRSLLKPLHIGNCLTFEVRLPFGPDDGLGEGS
jgi:hypothetical protein